MDTPLVAKTRGADRFIVVVTGAQARIFDITAAEYGALALTGGGRPPGTTRAEWEQGRASAYGGVHDYGGADRLAHGEIVEFGDRFELGVLLRYGRLLRVTIPKVDVLVTRTDGLTIVPFTAWPAETEIVSIDRGVLRRLD